MTAETMASGPEGVKRFSHSEQSCFPQVFMSLEAGGRAARRREWRDTERTRKHTHLHHTAMHAYAQELKDVLTSFTSNYSLSQNGGEKHFKVQGKKVKY